MPLRIVLGAAVFRKVGLTETFRLTSVLLIIAILMLALEYRNMEARQRTYYECKASGVNINGCDHQIGQKWRGERNFWMVGFNLLCWLMVDRLSERIKMEEAYTGGDHAPRSSPPRSVMCLPLFHFQPSVATSVVQALTLPLFCADQLSLPRISSSASSPASTLITPPRLPRRLPRRRPRRPSKGGLVSLLHRGDHLNYIS